VSHIGLGLFIGMKYGFHTLEDPVKIAFLTIYMPAVPVCVGIVQLVWSACALQRFYKLRNSMDDPQLPETEETVGKYTYLYLTGFTWIVTIVIQVFLQTAWSQGSASIAEGAVYTTALTGLFLMPLWTDNKARNTAARVDRRQWALPENTTCEDGFLENLLGLTEGRDPNDLESGLPPRPQKGLNGASTSSSITDEEDDFSGDDVKLKDMHLDEHDSSGHSSDDSSDDDGSYAFSVDGSIV
jgi:hypothetical protein